VKGREFSIVICTFNGAARIERVLTALAELSGGTAHEIILVDNCSTDGVGAVASAIWERIGQPSVDFRVIFEPTLGLSAARRAGVRAATREVVVFCDDDNLLAPNYLEVAASIMADQTIGAAGGPNTPTTDAEIPPLFYSYAAAYSVGAQALASGDVEVLWGAGLVVRRELLLRLYDIPGFPILIGRRGSALTTGEDGEICHGLSFLGYRLWYDERLNLEHAIPAERIGETYVRRLMKGLQAAHPVVSRYAELRRITNQTFAQQVRSIFSAAARLPVFVRRRDARFFGLIARFGMTSLMTLEERAIFEISCSLRKSRQRVASRPGRRAVKLSVAHLSPSAEFRPFA
jgi:glycosyltransferase involved in cell wall biosynthesis